MKETRDFTSTYRKAMKMAGIFLMAACFAFLVNAFTGARTVAAGERVVRVAYSEIENFTEGAADGKPKSGYGYEYLQKVASYSGWTYEYVYGDWSECYRMLRDGEVDLYLGLAYSEERAEIFAFPDYSMGEERFYIYCMDDSMYANRPLAAMDGQKIGCVKNTIMQPLLEEWLKGRAFKCEIAYYDSDEALYEAIVSGEVAAICDTDRIGVPKERLISKEKIDSAEYYIGVCTKKPVLLSELNQALASLSEQEPYFLTNLTGKYHTRYTDMMELTYKEQIWLKEHEVIRVGYLSNYEPYSMMDEDGNAAGAMIDLMADIVAESGMTNTLEYHPYENYADLIEAMGAGEVDLALPVYLDAWYAEENHFIVGTTLGRIVINLVYKDSYAIAEDQMIAVAKSSPVQSEYVARYYPNNTQLLCESPERAIKAVERGKAAATLVGTYMANALLKNSSLKMIQVANDVEVTYATTYENRQFITILNKGFSLLNESSFDNYVLKHADATYVFNMNSFVAEHWVVCLTVLLGVFALIIVIILSYLYIAYQNRKRLTERDAKLKEQFEVLMTLSSAYDAVNLLDLEHGIITKYEPKSREMGRGPLADPGRSKLNKKLFGTVAEGYKEDFWNFTDLTTLKDRMGEHSTISLEFPNVENHWFRAQYSVLNAEKTQYGYSVQLIDGEKEKEMRLIRLSTIDGLTNLLNRRAYETDTMEWKEKGVPKDLILFSVDINGLKQLNDTKGHIAGDELILESANVLTDAWGSLGKVYRTGGDEFMAILQTGRDGNDLRDQVMAAAERFKGRHVERMTLSVGYASKRDFPNAGIKRLAEIADAAMYIEKQNYYKNGGYDRRGN